MFGWFWSTFAYVVYVSHCFVVTCNTFQMPQPTPSLP
nr:MAG TPA: hypothetical protein [Caudoviricetes sp.]